jgi:hypothetical protein
MRYRNAPRRIANAAERLRIVFPRRAWEQDGNAASLIILHEALKLAASATLPLAG